MGFFGAIGKVFKPIAKVVGKAVNFVPNLLGKIPVVGKALKFVSSLAMGGLIPGLGWTGILGKMGGLGQKLSHFSGLKHWGQGQFQAHHSLLGKLPLQKPATAYQRLASELLQSSQQEQAQPALMAQQFMAQVQMRYVL